MKKGFILHTPLADGIPLTLHVADPSHIHNTLMVTSSYTIVDIRSSEEIRGGGGPK